jgi:uncharacterized protein YbjT (DUF2867 family)
MIVITAPTGNVGTEVVSSLAHNSFSRPYRVAAHNPQKITDTYGSHIPVVRLDYDDHATWPAVLADIDLLFLVFPVPQPRTVNTRMKPFIDAAVNAGCRHIVYISVLGADSSPVIPHYHVEKHVKESGVHYTILRASFFMQNLCRKISTHGMDIAARNEIFIPAGKGKFSFIDARDVAAVALQVFAHPDAYVDHIFNFTGPERLDLFQVAPIFSRVLARPIRYTHPSMLHFWFRLLRRGVSWDTIFFMTIVYTLTRLGRNENINDELPKTLGRPATKMPQFVEDYKQRWLTQTWT